MYSTLLKYPSMHDFVSLWSAMKIITNILSKPNPFKSYQLYISAVFLYVVLSCKILPIQRKLKPFGIHFTYMYNEICIFKHS